MHERQRPFFDCSEFRLQIDWAMSAKGTVKTEKGREYNTNT